MGDSSYKNSRPLWIVAFCLQLLSENKEHIEGNIQYLGNLIFRRSFRQILTFRRSLKKVSFIGGKFLRKVLPYKGNIL